MCQLLNLREITTPIRPALWRTLLTLPKKALLRVLKFLRPLRRPTAGDTDALKVGSSSPAGKSKHRAGSNPARQLEKGDVVRVRSEEEIKATLDERGKVGEMWFMHAQRKYCGKTFRVRKRVERIVAEDSGKMLRCRDTVILEGARCHGSAGETGVCGRLCPTFWKEAWLEKLE